MLARFFLIAAVACLFIVPVASAEIIDAEFAGVMIDITPTIDVMYDGGIVDMSSAQALDLICANLTFTVHANDQIIQMRAGASKLFKDDNPMSPFMIPVALGEEVVLTVDEALVYYEQHGDLPTLETTFDAGPHGIITIYHTPWMGFGSGLNGTWSFDVDVFICWQGTDAELPTGMYSGAVVLWAQFPVI